MMLKKHSLHLSVQKTRHSSTNFGMAFQYRCNRPIYHVYIKLTL